MCARVCLSKKKQQQKKHKTKKKRTEQKSNNKPTFPFRCVLALSRKHICRVFLRGLDGELDAFSSRCLAKSVCWICAAAQNNFPGARLWVLHPPQLPGEDLTHSPVHSRSLRKVLHSPSSTSHDQNHTIMISCHGFLCLYNVLLKPQRCSELFFFMYSPGRQDRSH